MTVLHYLFKNKNKIFVKACPLSDFSQRLEPVKVPLGKGDQGVGAIYLRGQ